MTGLCPKIDERNREELLMQLRNLAVRYCPDVWEGEENAASDLYGETIIQVFAHMMEVVTQRLNRVPDKNFLAFLDMLGMNLASSRPSRTVLAFALAKGAEYAYVPEKTQIASTESSDGKPLIFETRKGVTVIAPTPVRALSIQPESDKWKDHSALLSNDEKECVETLFEGVDPVKHRLYLGHNELFSFNNPPKISLILNIEGEPPVEGRHIKWFTFSDNPGEPLELLVDEENSNPAAVNLQGSGTVTFKEVISIPAKAISGFEGTGGCEINRTNRWIFAELTSPISKIKPAKIKSIKAVVDELSPLPGKPDKAFFNNFPVDLTKDFYPFGERPKFNDTFSIGADDIFRQEGTTLTIDVTLSPSIEKPDTGNIQLIWEVWTGNRWDKLGITGNSGVADAGSCSFMDSTNAFTTSGKVIFICPSVKSSEASVEKNASIRVRIIDGYYGKEAAYQEEPAGAYKYIPATYKPPSVKDLLLSYTAVPSDMGEVITYNDFSWEDQTHKMTSGDKFFLPFKPVADQTPSFYIAFENDVAGLPVTLFFPFKSRRFVPAEAENAKNPVLAWEYWNGEMWSPLLVEDGTEGMRRREMISFIAPSDIDKKACFGEKRLWIRARLSEDRYGNNPHLGGIYSNTVWADNLVTVTGGLLGSGNGEGGQLFNLVNSPVLKGQTILVREASLTEEERKKVIKEEGIDAVEEIKDDADNLLERWVHWHEVEHFSFSGPHDRHYIIDRNRGTIRFGDGKKGMIPPAGKNNIKCGQYSCGGGECGNVASGTVTKLRTSIPYIAAVTNPVPATGGTDMESMEDLKVRGPQTLKHRDRAVTYEDFEWIAKYASPMVAKVKCLPEGRLKPGAVCLYVIPHGKENKPLPTEELANEVRDYLHDRVSGHLASFPTPMISICPPDYVEVSVEATVIFESAGEAKIVKDRISGKLEQFFHPLYGGSNGEGWNFGRNACISEVYKVIEDSDGVDYVETASFLTEDGSVETVFISDDSLVCSGFHKL